MPIPAKKMKINLTKTAPTELTVENLQKQLNNIGLSCKLASKLNLKEYITTVKSELPEGAIQTFGINGPAKSTDGSLCFKSEFDAVNRTYLGLEESAVGNWKPDASGIGYSDSLEYIQFSSHFDYLMKNRPSFTGVKLDQPAYKKKYNTVDGIKSLFVKVGKNASASLIKGLDKDSIEAVLSNAIAPLAKSQVKDYDESDNRVIFLVDNYNPSTQEADGIGVLTINWRLQIKDYKEKKKNLKHDTNLKIHVRSVVYSSLAALYTDIEFVKSHLKTNMFMLAIPSKNTVEIFDALPPACADTFHKSLPTVTKHDHVDVIVLYSPDLDNIGCLDNSNSDGESSYSKSVTSGFTFTSSQTLSGEIYFEASAEVVKAGIKVGFSITFTEQWNSSTTETMSFSVPAGKKAFTYQGYLYAATLRFDAESGNYKYVDYGKFMSNILMTSKVPLIDD